MGWSDDMTSAPKDGTPVLVELAPKQQAARDGWHGPVQVAANRGRGWASIPGLWQCTPIRWHEIPRITPATRTKEQKEGGLGGGSN